MDVRWNMLCVGRESPLVMTLVMSVRMDMDPESVALGQTPGHYSGSDVHYYGSVRVASQTSLLWVPRLLAECQAASAVAGADRPDVTFGSSAVLSGDDMMTPPLGRWRGWSEGGGGGRRGGHSRDRRTTSFGGAVIAGRRFLSLPPVTLRCARRDM